MAISTPIYDKSGNIVSTYSSDESLTSPLQAGYDPAFGYSITAPKTEQLMVTTENAADEVNGAKETLDQLSGTAPTDTKKTSEKTDKETVSDTDLAALLEDKESAPVNATLSAAEAEATRLGNEYKSILADVDNYKISDEEIKGQVDSITSLYDSRIREMQDINERRERSFETTGYRIGAQYTGGVRGGVFGGVISEEERQGLTRIGALEAEKQQKISSAKEAARAQNWKVYVEKAKGAQEAYKGQLKVLEDLNKLEVESRKKLGDERKKIEYEENIAVLYKAGVTEAADIQSFLKDKGYSVSLKDIKDTLEIINPPKEYTGLSTDFKTFRQFFPDADVTTAAGRAQYLKWEAQVAAANRKGEGSGASAFKFSSEQQSQLFSGGFKGDEIQHLQEGVAANGLDVVLDAERAAGMSEDRLKLIRRVLAKSDTVADITNAEDSIFTREYVSGLFDIPDTEEKTQSFLGFGYGATGTAQLDALMKSIEAWRNAGYSDEEIQKELEKD